MTSDFLSLLTADDAAGGDGGGRVRAVAFECLVSGIIDERAVSVLRLAGFDGDFGCFAIAGRPADGGGAGAAIATIRQAVHDLGGSEPLTGVHDGAVVALIRLEAAVRPEATCTAVSKAFAPGTPICLGPTRRGVEGASIAMRAALTTLAAAPALSNTALSNTALRHTPVPNRAAAHRPTVLHAEDALPERAMLGDQEARRELVDEVYAELLGNSDDDPTMLTVATFLESGGSLEVTARALSVHPNTVRYRLKRMADTTGWDATDPRDAFVLTCAIALGRIAQHSRP